VNYNKNRLFIGNWRKWRVKTGTLAEIFFCLLSGAGRGRLAPPTAADYRAQASESSLATDAFIAILAGACGLVEINARVRSDRVAQPSGFPSDALNRAGASYQSRERIPHL
jgi:hypothetical protein